ncbi:hypothetical protein [Bacillus sp. Marseille-Q1617]|uniref:hypothetical protein n=1 Tax=Bacillus sp. Marseille-Q1617 TaxID=2736887 RepID=UPI00158CDE52|nr:hypothetical protein [Bacillus sp. Marseille-Q1617]
MIVVLILFTTLLLGYISFLLNGKNDWKRIKVPLLLYMSGTFLLLYAKLAVGDFFLTFLLMLPALGILGLSTIWLFILSVAKNGIGKKLLRTTIFCFITPILFLIGLNQETTFIFHKTDYNIVSDALFKAVDNGKINVGAEFSTHTYDQEKLKPFLSERATDKMDRLRESGGVYSIIIADRDVIYFSHGAAFQSISGIAITRNGKDPEADKGLKSRFFDGNTSFRHLINEAYYFSDGL